jgi:hypothetical protein
MPALVRGIHVGELATDDFADATDVHAFAICIDALGFLAEKHIIAGDAHGFSAEVADHAHEAGIDFLGKHARDDIDRFIGGDAEAADEFRHESGLFHGGRDRLAAAVDDDGIDAGHFEKDDVTHDFGNQIRILHGGAAHFDQEGLAAEGLKIGQGFDEGVRFGDGVHGGEPRAWRRAKGKAER